MRASWEAPRDDTRPFEGMVRALRREYRLVNSEEAARTIMGRISRLRQRSPVFDREYVRQVDEQSRREQEE